MTNITDIAAAIVTKLETIPTLNGVYAYEIATPVNGQYPFATVTQSEFMGEFADTQRNKRKYNFIVRVYQERTQAAFGNAKGESLIRTIIDEILTAFDNDTRLGGTVLWVVPASGNFDYIDREIGDTRVCEIVLECVTVVPSLT